MAMNLLKLGFLLAGCQGTIVLAETQPPKPAATATMFLAAPENLKWTPIRPGNEMAVVDGDPTKPGELYIVRFRMADGFKVPAHWHPMDEYATVLKGTLLLGMGDKWDAAELRTTMPTGSYLRMPKEMRHFAQAQGETILQAHGVGPFKIIYVNPADEPTRQASPPPGR